jgi:hypothetical protein
MYGSTAARSSVPKTSASSCGEAAAPTQRPCASSLSARPRQQESGNGRAARAATPGPQTSDPARGRDWHTHTHTRTGEVEPAGLHEAVAGAHERRLVDGARGGVRERDAVVEVVQREHARVQVAHRRARAEAAEPVRVRGAVVGHDGRAWCRRAGARAGDGGQSGARTAGQRGADL